MTVFAIYKKFKANGWPVHLALRTVSQAPTQWHSTSKLLMAIGRSSSEQVIYTG
jgi:hypothetical protein